MRTASYFAVLLAASMILVAGGCAPDPTEGKDEAQVNPPAQTQKEDAAGPESDADAADDSGAAVEPAEDAAAMTDEADAGADATVYVMQTDQSSVGFAGSKVTGTHTGGFAEYDGKVTVQGDDLTTAKIDITFDMTSTYSDDQDLTDRLVGPEFFHVEEYPTASFKSTGVEKTDDGYKVSGDFTLHGVTNNISFPAKIDMSEDTLTAEAEFSINRKNWDIVYDGMADDAIREKVLITLYVVAEPEAA